MFNYIFLYPYPYHSTYMLITFILLAIIGFVALFIYAIVTSFMNKKAKRIFNLTLKILGIVIFVCFTIEGMFSLITIHQMNKHPGFTYATPDTPEGELFEIQKVVPGGVMDKAGLKRFDRVQMNNVNRLYKLLRNNKGEEIQIPVKRDGQILEIKVLVPEIKVTFEKVSLSPLRKEL